MPKIELEIDDVETLISVLMDQEEFLIRHGNREALERFDRTAKVVRQDLQKWRKENEWVEFETPIGKFAVNRLKQMKFNDLPMREGTHTITMNVAILAERAFPNG